jgi:hypothetical protein
VVKLARLLRTGDAGPEAGGPWFALSSAWGGNIAVAGPLLRDAVDDIQHQRLNVADCADVWLATAQTFHILYEPEYPLATWESAWSTTSESGDDARAALIGSFSLLLLAEFVEAEYVRVCPEVGPTLESFKKGSPAIKGFFRLAEGRHLNKQRAGSGASEALIDARDSFRSGEATEWSVFGEIELSKALLDAGDVKGADRTLDSVADIGIKSPILAIWFLEARGQWNAALGHRSHAAKSFQMAVDIATDLGLERRANVLRQYLQN